MRRKGGLPAAPQALGPPLEWLSAGFLPQMGVRACEAAGLPPFWDLWGSNPRAYIALGLKSNSLTTRTKSLNHSVKIPYTRSKSLNHSVKIPYTRSKSLTLGQIPLYFPFLRSTAFAIYCVCAFVRLRPAAFVRLPSTSYCVCASYCLLRPTK